MIHQGTDHGDRGSGKAEEDGGEPGAQGQEEEPAKDEAAEDEGNVESLLARAFPML